METKDTNNTALRGYEIYLKATGKAKGTITLRRSHIRRCLEHVDKPLDEITLDDLLAWLASNTWAGEARASARSSLRSFFAWAEMTQRIQANPAERVPTVSRPKTVPRPVPDAYLVDALRNHTTDKRARLAIELMAMCGLRRDECARVRACDVEPDGQGWVIRVQGKGQRVRVVPCPPSLARRIKESGGYLFPGNVDGHISAAWLGKLVRRALPGGYTPHKIRHRYASVAYINTHDLRSVQELLGHSSLATTQVYVGVDHGARVETAQATWKIAS